MAQRETLDGSARLKHMQMSAGGTLKHPIKEPAAVTKDIETYFENNQWHVRFEGETLVFESFSLREEAVARGQEIATRGGVLHHVVDPDGGVELS